MSRRGHHTNHPWRQLTYKDPHFKRIKDKLAEIRKWSEDPDKLPSDVRVLQGAELEAVKKRLEAREGSSPTA